MAGAKSRAGGVKAVRGPRKHRRFMLALGTIVALAAGGTARAADFYAGKTLTLLVGYAAGGGYDLNARLLARHIGRHIPGHPSIIVQNMPGAGSLHALEYLQRSAPADGTFVGLFDFTQITNSLLTPEHVPIDFRKFSWIGSIAQDLAVCYMWRAFGVTDLASARTRPQINMGRTNPGSSSDIEQQMLHKLFHVNVHSVGGYGGSAEAALAVERGELDGGCLTWSSLPPEWSQQHKIVPILKFSSATAPDLPPDLPNAVDIAENDRSRQIIAVLSDAGEIGKPFITQASVPADVVAILRAAFDETMKDAQFLADAATIRQPVTPKSAAQAQAILQKFYATPPDIVKAARAVASE
jgi:tripartite-type tricarboxylate transporter receptor subunit TctC